MANFVNRRDAFRRTLNLAAMVGCPTSGSSKKDVIDCLKTKSAEEITNKEMQVVSDTGLHFQPFVPTSEGDLLKLEPRKLLPRILQKFKNTQILIGTNSDEGSVLAMNYLPEVFPNEDFIEMKLSKNVFDESVGKLFVKYPEKVRIFEKCTFR